MLPLHHARGSRRIPIGLPLLLVAVILTFASTQEGTRLLRSYRQARYERTSAELQADRWVQPEASMHEPPKQKMALPQAGFHTLARRRLPGARCMT